MSIIDRLRACGTEHVTIRTAEGSVSGFINQTLLTERTVFTLVGDTPVTPANEATVVAIDAISAVTSAT